MRSNEIAGDDDFDDAKNEEEVTEEMEESRKLRIRGFNNPFFVCP